MSDVDPDQWLEQRLGISRARPVPTRPDLSVVEGALISGVVDQIPDPDPVIDINDPAAWASWPAVAPDTDDKELYDTARMLIDDEDPEIAEAARLMLAEAGESTYRASGARYLSFSDASGRYANAIELAGSSSPTIASTAARYLAEHGAAQRRAAAQAPPARPGLCGAPDAYSRCSARYHDADCAASLETAAHALSYTARGDDAGAVKAAADEQQHMASLAAHPVGTFLDQDKAPFTMSAFVEASLGQSTHRGFGPNRPELRAPVKQMALHDRSGDDVGLSLEKTRAALAGLRAQVDPVKETPAQLSARRTALGHPPGRPGRHWGDA